MNSWTMDRWELNKVWHLSVPPMGAPRQVRRDQSPAAKRYRAYKQELRSLNVWVPDSRYWLVFGMPMPKSWPALKRDAMWGTPHQSRPDKDRLEKAVLDAIYADRYADDRKVWDGRVSKVWTTKPMIILLVADWCGWIGDVMEESGECSPRSRAMIPLEDLL